MLKIFPGSEFSDLAWYDDDSLDPEKDVFSEYEVMKDPTTQSLVRVKKEKVRDAIANKYSIAGDDDFDSYTEAKRKAVLSESMSGFVPGFMNTSHAFLKGFFGFDPVRPLVVSSGKMSAQEYEDVIQARAAASSRPAAAIAEAAGVVAPLASALKGVGAASRAAAYGIEHLSPLTWMAKLGEKIGAKGAGITAAAPISSRLAPLAASEVAPIAVAAKAGTGIAKVAEAVLPHAAGQAAAGALWGAATGLEESYSNEYSAKQTVDVVVNDMKAHAALFGAMGGTAGLLAPALEFSADRVEGVFDFWRKKMPIYGEEAVRKQWPEYLEPGRLETAEILADSKTEYLDFIENIKDGGSLLVDSEPEVAQWLLRNRKQLAKVAKKGGSGAVANFRNFVDRSGKFDAEMADTMLGNYDRIISDIEAPRFSQELTENLADMVILGDEIERQVNTRLLDIENRAMSSVGRPGGPPNIDAVEFAIDNIEGMFRKAIEFAEKNPLAIDNATINPMRVAKNAFIEEVKKIRNERIEDVEVKPKDIYGPARTERRPVTDPADPVRAYNSIRKLRTEFLKKIMTQKQFHGPNPSPAQEAALKLMDEVKSGISANIHDPMNWGPYAKVREAMDAAMSDFRGEMDAGTVFNKTFLKSTNVDGEVRYTADGKKVASYVKQAGKFYSQETEKLGAEQTSANGSLARFRSSFNNLVKTAESIQPDLWIEAPGGRRAFPKVAEAAKASELTRLKNDLESIRNANPELDRVQALESEIESTRNQIAAEEARAAKAKNASQLQEAEDSVQRLRSSFNSLELELDLIKRTEAFQDAAAISDEISSIESMSPIDGNYFSYQNMRDFVDNIVRAQDDLVSRAVVTETWENASERLNHGLRYEQKGELSPLDKAISKTAIGKAVSGVAEVVVGAPKYQWQIEPRLRGFAVAEKKAQQLHKQLESFSKWFMRGVFQRAVPSAQVVALEQKVGKQIQKQYFPTTEEKRRQEQEDAEREALLAEADEDDDTSNLPKDEATQIYWYKTLKAAALASDIQYLSDHVERQIGAISGAMPDFATEFASSVRSMAQEISKDANINQSVLDEFIATESETDAKRREENIKALIQQKVAIGGLAGGLPQISDDDLARHRRTLMASTAAGLAKLIAERKLTADDVLVAERTIPSIVTEMRLQMMNELTDHIETGNFIDQGDAQVLVTFLRQNLPADENQQRRARTAQTVYSKMRLGKSEKSADSRPLPAAGKVTVDSRSQTDMQRVESRKQTP